MIYYPLIFCFRVENFLIKTEKDENNFVLHGHSKTITTLCYPKNDKN